jgi:hypothetical protein
VTRRCLLLTGGALLVLLPACGGDGPEPGPVAGEVTVSLATGVPNAGALLLRVVGPITQIEVLGGHRMASAALGASNASRVVLSGRLAAGDILRLKIPDVSLYPGSYTVFVEQAAALDDFALLDPALFTLTLRR